MMYFKIYRNCDTWRLRKVVIELWYQDGDERFIVDKRRSFAIFPHIFEKRLARKKQRMIELAKIMDKASGVVDC